MEDFTIILADGTTLEHVQHTYMQQFCIEGPIDFSIFNKNNLSTVEICRGELSEVLKNQICDSYYTQENITYFQFRDMTELEQLKQENELLQEELAAAKILLGLNT